MGKVQHFEIRAFSDVERAVLERICAADNPDAAAARIQLTSASYAGKSHGDDLCFDIAVADDSPLVSSTLGPWTTLTVYEGEEFVGWVELEFVDGRMAGVDYTWVTPEMPSTLPTPSQLRLEDSSPQPAPVGLRASSRVRSWLLGLNPEVRRWRGQHSR